MIAFEANTVVFNDVSILYPDTFIFEPLIEPILVISVFGVVRG